jgi:hypothetical protein
MVMNNNYSFGLKNALVLSIAGALCGKSTFLGCAYLAGGAACLGLALVLALLWLAAAPSCLCFISVSTTRRRARSIDQRLFSVLDLLLLGCACSKEEHYLPGAGTAMIALSSPLVTP